MNPYSQVLSQEVQAQMAETFANYQQAEVVRRCKLTPAQRQVEDFARAMQQNSLTSLLPKIANQSL